MNCRLTAEISRNLSVRRLLRANGCTGTLEVVSDDAIGDDLDDDDLDDTVIVPPRAQVSDLPPDVADTVIPMRPKQRIDHATGEPIPEAITVGTSQPDVVETAFYAFRVGVSSEAVLLDVPCYVGRRPSAPRIARARAPKLLQVASPLKEVSASHVELRQVGASVIVTDLKSTNGSIVMIPGSVPRTLRQGESVVVSPGTLVDIGDGNILQVLPMQRRTTPTERQP